MQRLHSAPAPRTLFHYTSTTALISIVANNEFWLSDATFLNDRVEVQHGRNVAQARLRSRIELIQSDGVRMMLSEALRRFEDVPDPAVYVVCFSLEKDDLAQWRAYGLGNAPVAIEIEHGPLMFGYASEAILAQVVYDVDDQVWIFDNVLDAYCEAFAQDLVDPRPSERAEPLSPDEERASCARSLYYGLWQYIVASKDLAFRAEREVRYVYIAHDFSGFSNGWYPIHPEPSFRESGGRVVPFLSSKSLDFTNMRRVREPPMLPIRSIRIGPTEDSGTIARGIRRLLDVHGHSEVTISTSGSPLRR